MKLIAPFAALAFALSIASAPSADGREDVSGEAASDESVGKIAAVGPSTLVLEDGATFVIGEGLSIEGLWPGAEVTVSFEEQDGEVVARKVARSGGAAVRPPWPKTGRGGS